VLVEDAYRDGNLTKTAVLAHGWMFLGTGDAVARYCQRQAVKDDVMEISYLGTVLETGVVFDGRVIKIKGDAFTNFNTMDGVKLG